MAATMCEQPIHPQFPIAVARSHGFSLVELLVVSAIVAVVMAVALPSMAAMLANQKVGAFASALLVSLQLARNDAVTRGGTTVVCKSSDGAQCVSGGGWEQGWIVFDDANHDAQRNPGERLLARQDGAPGGLSVRGNTPVARYVSYNALGSTRLVSGALQAGTFTVCTTSPILGTESRQLVLAVTGRVRIQSGPAGVCP
jgi:type IV fimbrial biogenesis protein FimT